MAHIISLFNIENDNLIAVIKTKLTCNEIEDSEQNYFKVLQVLSEYGIYCTDFYCEDTPWLFSDIII